MPSVSVASTSSKATSPPLFTSDFDSDLFDILFETNLLQYYHNFATDLKVSNPIDLRNLTDSDLESIGLNQTEIRRIRRVIKKESNQRTFSRLRKKFSFRASRISFDSVNGERLSLFNPKSSGQTGSQDDSSSVFRSSSNASNMLRRSARHLSLTRCGPAPPLVALLDPDLVTLIPTKILGEGEFATVYQGILRKDALSSDRDGMVGCMGLSASIPQNPHYKALASDFATYKMPGDKSSKLITVAIKKFAPNCLGRPLHVFLQNIALLSDLRHCNLLHIFGCYTDEYCQPALVCELASLRSLIDVFSDPDLRIAITPMHLCRYAEQIASAMAYLERRHVIHGDLACRNIMLANVNVNGQVKVADYGLLRALGALLTSSGSTTSSTNVQTPPSSSTSDDANSTSTDYSKLRLPVAWCAPETLRAVEMTSSSDVWSFGVTLWEMFSYGEQPWNQLSATEILDAVDAPNGQRLPQPDYCPRDYYEDVMLRCWLHEASDRPTFAYLEQHLPLVRPDQVQTVKNSLPPVDEEQEDLFRPVLNYTAGEIITVLDKRTGKQSFWKGVTCEGCLGYFLASDVVFYTDLLVPSLGGESATLRIAPTPPLQADKSLKPIIQHPSHLHNSISTVVSTSNPTGFVFSPTPPSQTPAAVDDSSSAIYHTVSEFNCSKQSDNFSVAASSICSKQTTAMPNDSKKHRFSGVIPSIGGGRSIDTSMISLPRGDLRHIGHIGFDGAVSGHVDFIAPGVERVCIERTSNQGTLPKQKNESQMRRADSFEDGFQLPDLSLESEVNELISTIRLSDFLDPKSDSKSEELKTMAKHGSASSFSKLSLNNSIEFDETSQSMRQPRQPSALLVNFDKNASSTLTMGYLPPKKQTYVEENIVVTSSPVQSFNELKISEPALSSPLTIGSSTASPSVSNGSSPRPTTNSIPTSSPTLLNNDAEPVKVAAGSQGSLNSWRYVDSPPPQNVETEILSGNPVVSKVNAPVSITTSTSVVATKISHSGNNRASIVTAEERQRVYDEVRQRCGHPLLMSDCLRAVSYTQGNIEAAVKFLKLQYLASHRVAEVERCKNALVACDWEVERALEMLRLRSSTISAPTNFASANSPSDSVVNV